MDSNITNSNITFVTGMFYLYEIDYDTVHKTIEKRIGYFEEFASAGLNICLYTDDVYIDRMKLLELKYSNVCVFNIHNIYQTNIGKILLEYEKNSGNQLKMPKNLNTLKDTREFMLAINLKTELTKYAIEQDCPNSNYYMWFDFSIGYIFKNRLVTLQYVKNIPMLEFKENFVYIPGCWNKDQDRYNKLIMNDDYLINSIVWRFCGGIIFWDKDKLLNFCNVCESNFGEFLTRFDTLVWEVNYWTWIERENKFNIIWEYRDHNDLMLILPDKTLK